MERKLKYYIYGDRPVKLVPTADGGLDCQAFVWGSKGRFERAMMIAAEIHNGDADTVEVKKADFDARVSTLSA